MSRTAYVPKSYKSTPKLHKTHSHFKEVPKAQPCLKLYSIDLDFTSSMPSLHHRGHKNYLLHPRRGLTCQSKMTTISKPNKKCNYIDSISTTRNHKTLITSHSNMMRGSREGQSPSHRMKELSRLFSHRSGINYIHRLQGELRSFLTKR